MALGSISFEQEPVNTSDKVPVITNWNPMVGYMLYQNDISGLFYFTLILEVYHSDSSGELLAKIKQRRNGYGPDDSGATQRARAYFDLSGIVNSRLVDTVFDQNQTGIPFETIHKIGANVTANPFSENGDNRTDEAQIMEIYVKGYQQYSSSATEIPAEDDTPNVTDTLYYMAASLPLQTARSESGGSVNSTYQQGDAFKDYQAAGSSDKFLSDVQSQSGEYGITGYINYVRYNTSTTAGDYHTVAFLNHEQKFNSHVDVIRVIYYTSAGVVINTSDVDNVTANGGYPPPNTAGRTDARGLLYYGCGPGNLQAQTVTGDSNAKPSNNPNWAYYTIRGLDGSANPMTALYYFIKSDTLSCKGYKIRRLAWRNSLGCYDYFNFMKKSVQTVDVTRNNYSTIVGRFNASKWYYNNTMRGSKTRKVTAILKETLQTDWISETDGELLEKLIMSTNVYIVENTDTTYTEPVMITDTSFIRKTVANNKLIQYTIKIEYANPINTNS